MEKAPIDYYSDLFVELFEKNLEYPVPYDFYGRMYEATLEMLDDNYKKAVSILDELQTMMVTKYGPKQMKVYGSIKGLKDICKKEVQ